MNRVFISLFFFTRQFWSTPMGQKAKDTKHSTWCFVRFGSVYCKVWRTKYSIISIVIDDNNSSVALFLNRQTFRFNTRRTSKRWHVWQTVFLWRAWLFCPTLWHNGAYLRQRIDRGRIPCDAISQTVQLLCQIICKYYRHTGQSFWQQG